MSFTFINPTTTSWQSLTIAKEIRVAYNKRRTACGLSTYADPTSKVKVYDFIHDMQIGIEEMATQFADYDATLEGVSTMPSHYATVTAAMTKAGLTATGFWRRIAEGGNHPVATDYTSESSYNDSGWSYGQIQNKDEAGIWLFIDIEKALTSLRRIIRGYTTSGVSPQYTRDVGGINYNGNYAWVTDNGDSVTGGPALSIQTGNYVSSSAAVGKTDYSLDNPEDNPVDVIEAHLTLVRYGVACGNSVTGTSRTVKFMVIPRGNFTFSGTSVAVGTLGQTTVTTEDNVDGGAFLKWYPVAPQSISGFQWLTLTDQFPDGEVVPDQYENMYYDVSYTDVASCTDYTFVDVATS